ncbi:hypothetical protein D3C71_945910 [compost metagenome]
MPVRGAAAGGRLAGGAVRITGGGTGICGGTATGGTGAVSTLATVSRGVSGVLAGGGAMTRPISPAISRSGCHCAMPSRQTSVSAAIRLDW